MLRRCSLIARRNCGGFVYLRFTSCSWEIYDARERRFLFSYGKVCVRLLVRGGIAIANIAISMQAFLFHRVKFLFVWGRWRFYILFVPRSGSLGFLWTFQLLLEMFFRLKIVSVFVARFGFKSGTLLVGLSCVEAFNRKRKYIIVDVVLFKWWTCTSARAKI